MAAPDHDTGIALGQWDVKKTFEKKLAINFNLDHGRRMAENKKRTPRQLLESWLEQQKVLEGRTRQWFAIMRLHTTPSRLSRWLSEGTYREIPTADMRAAIERETGGAVSAKGEW